MARSIIQDMVVDLADFAIPDIERAIVAYRQMPFPPGKFKPFPDSGTLRKLAGDERRHRDEISSVRSLRPQFGESRPLCWWGQHREFWKPHWRESEVPHGELCRDKITGKLREPERVGY